MPFINVGAQHDDNGVKSSINSKAELKRLIAADPMKVRVYSTSGFTPTDLEFVSDLKADGTKLSVVGPDPYTSRKWYATIYRTDKGAIKVE